MDRLSPEKRSWLMSRIRSKDTTPERIVRSLIHRMGFRFRLHRADLPGKPDLVLPSRGKVIFVHGCFWHGHRCKRDKMPKSHVKFWLMKIETNRKRDARVRRALRALGWDVLVVWECETKKPGSLERKVASFLIF